jgi:hypothetical protein
MNFLGKKYINIGIMGYSMDQKNLKKLVKYLSIFWNFWEFFRIFSWFFQPEKQFFGYFWNWFTILGTF